MHTNRLLKWITIPLILLTIYGAMKLLAGSHEAAPSSRSTPNQPRLTADESDALNADADTPADTVATLVGQVKQLRTELKSALDESAKTRAENDRLRSRDGSLDQRIQTAIRVERDQWTRENLGALEKRTDGAVKELTDRLDALSKGSEQSDLPVGLGLRDDDAESQAAAHIRWIEPDSRTKRSVAKKQGSPIASAFGEAADQAADATQAATDSLADAAHTHLRGSSIVPFYTAPQNSTLIGSVAMTALIGRVPIDGTVNDPYPFKILVGADNLTANGIELPQLEGAVMSGTASGDSTLSCVRGQIYSVTFVFQDGSTVTIPKNNGDDERGGRAQNRSVLATISDEFGIPCISGTVHTNARQYLTTQTLLTAAGAGAASLINSGRSSYSFLRGSDGTTLGNVGISGQEAMERVLAGGVQEMSQWISRMYGQAYAAVYVPPGAPVAVHLERPLLIDLDPHGRKVIHQSEPTHASDLD